jgi:hypothetical protein
MSVLSSQLPAITLFNALSNWRPDILTIYCMPGIFSFPHADYQNSLCFSLYLFSYWLTALLKNLEDSVLEPLLLIFKQSIREWKVPTEWKMATVTPIYKKGTKCGPRNYKPVSLTSVPCKILESLIREKLTNHLIKNNLLRDSNMDSCQGAHKQQI